MPSLVAQLQVREDRAGKERAELQDHDAELEGQVAELQLVVESMPQMVGITQARRLKAALPSLISELLTARPPPPA